MKWYAFANRYVQLVPSNRCSMIRSIQRPKSQCERTRLTRPIIEFIYVRRFSQKLRGDVSLFTQRSCGVWKVAIVGFPIVLFNFIAVSIPKALTHISDYSSSRFTIMHKFPHSLGQEWRCVLFHSSCSHIADEQDQKWNKMTLATSFIYLLGKLK